jgi:hypothetical protein
LLRNGKDLGRLFDIRKDGFGQSLWWFLKKKKKLKSQKYAHAKKKEKEIEWLIVNKLCDVFSSDTF